MTNERLLGTLETVAPELVNSFAFPLPSIAIYSGSYVDITTRY